MSKHLNTCSVAPLPYFVNWSNMKWPNFPKGSRCQQARFIPGSPLRTQRPNHCATALHNGGVVDARQPKPFA